MNILPQIELAITEGKLLKRPKNEKGKHFYINPIEIAIPTLIATSGGPLEILGYYQNNTDAASSTKNAFKSILYHTAHKMFLNNKSLSEMALNHPAIRDKVHIGPISRLAYPDKVARVLGLLCVDPSTYLELCKKGNMDWDDGTYETAMAINYGWRRILPDKFKLTQSHIQVHFEIRSYLKKILKKYPNQPVVKFANERYKMSWYLKNDSQKKEAKVYFSSLSNIKGDDENSKLWRMLGNSSLIDFGLRYPNPKLLQPSFESLEQDLNLKQRELPNIQLAKAKMFVQMNDTVSVKKMASKLSKYDSPFYKMEALQLYHTIGDTKKALLLKKQLINN